MTRQSYTAPDGPPAAGPYSPAVGDGDLIFLSGQIALGADGATIGETVADQARAALENMRSLLAAAGCDMDAVCKTTIFLTDMADFAAVNEVYADYFDAPYPARSTVAVAALPLGVKVEIDAIAVR